MIGSVKVPCGSCHACCHSEIVAILPEERDRLADYEHNTIETPHGPLHTLKHRPDGSCVYLGETGCTIHGRAPYICRIFDCRRWFRAHSRAQRRQMEKTSPGTKIVFAAGRERLSSLGEQ